MTRKKYERLKCERIAVEPSRAILAESVNNNSTVASVGQEVGVEVEFAPGDYVNTSWETGF